MTSIQAQAAFATIVAVGITAAVFRVATAPDRIKHRKDTARTVCMGSGGQWIVVGRDEVCHKPSESAPKR